MKNLKIFIKTMGLMGKKCPIYLISIVLMSSSWAMFTVMSSLLVKSVVDAAESGETRNILYIIAGNVIGGILSLLVYRASAIRYNVEAKRAYSVLSKALFYHEVRLPYEYYELHHSGEFMSKLSYDMEKMGAIYGSRFRRTVTPLLQVIVFIVPMFFLSPHMTLCLVGVNMCMLLTNALLINPIRKVTKRLSKTNATLTEKLSNLLYGMEQARMYRSGKDTVEEFGQECDNYKKQSNMKIFYIGILESSNKGFELLFGLAFLVLGLYFVNTGRTTLGALAAIYTLSGNFSLQFLQLGRYLPELIGNLVNAQNIFNFLDEKREPECWYDGDMPSGDVGEEAYVKFENVTFSYSEDTELLKDFSLSIKRGESIAITGPSGCGKTTLSKLMLNLYPLKEGSIYIDGKSYKNMKNSEVRSYIAYVPQEPYLFDDTIIENIKMGREGATDEEAVEAAKKAYAHDFITEFEEGYNTYVGERGNRLSGGQRQRIAIARAILKDSPVILLDEATSALDNESEEAVNKALKNQMKDKTIIMIAHRPSTIALADRVISLG